MAYVRGMGRYRGMGQIADSGTTASGQQITIAGVLPNCPGDPGCPGNNPMVGTPLTPAQIAALSASNAAYFNQPTTTGQTFTQWLNTNTTTVMIVAGAVLALAMLK